MPSFSEARYLDRDHHYRPLVRYIVGNGDDCALQDGLVFIYSLLDLAGRDGFATRDTHILLAITHRETGA